MTIYYDNFNLQCSVIYGLRAQIYISSKLCYHIKLITKVLISHLYLMLCAFWEENLLLAMRSFFWGILPLDLLQPVRKSIILTSLGFEKVQTTKKKKRPSKVTSRSVTSIPSWHSRILRVDSTISRQWR